MISQILASALLLTQATTGEVVAKRTLGNQEVDIMISPLASWPLPERPMAKVGRDWVFSASQGELLSLRKTDPLKWLKLTGDQLPVESAQKLTVVVRSFEKVEGLAPGRSLSWRATQTELDSFKVALAAAEAVLETMAKGQIDVEITYIPDPTPLRSIDSDFATPAQQCLRALAREDEWENAEGRVSQPYHVHIGAIPVASDTITVSGERAPIAIIGNRGSQAALVHQVIEATLTSVAQRHTTFRNLGRLPTGMSPEGWQSALRLAEWSQTDEASSPKQLTGIVPWPMSAFNPKAAIFSAGPNAYGDELLQINSLTFAISALGVFAPITEADVAQVRNILSSQSATNAAQGIEFHRNDGGTLSFKTPEAEAEKTTLTHNGAQPWGVVPFAKLPAGTQSAQIKVRATSSMRIPIGLVAGTELVHVQWMPYSASSEPVEWFAQVSIDPNYPVLSWVTTSLDRTRTYSPIGGQQIVFDQLEIIPSTESIAPQKVDPVDPATAVIASLSGDTPDARIQALDLVEFGATPEQLALMKENARSIDFGVSLAALKALKRCAPDEFGPALRFALSAGPFEHNRVAGAMLMKQDPIPEYLKDLTTLVLAGEWTTRVFAAEALAQFDSVDADVSLVLLLTDPEPVVRYRAAQGLKLRGELPVRRLQYAMVNDPCEGVRALAATKLLTSSVASARTEAVRMLSDSSAKVRLAVVQAMAEQGLEEYKPWIKVALNDRSPRVRLIALQNGQKFGLTQDDVRPLRDDTYPEIQEELKNWPN